MVKICNICLKEKLLSDYYINKGMADGHQNRCIECTKQKTKERQEIINSNPQLREKELKRHRDKYHRLNYKDKHKPTPEKKQETMKAYRERYPEKYKAKIAVQHGVIDGMEQHHWSYNTEHHKDVILLTNSEHAKIHRYIIYDQEQMMYRRSIDNILLNTKEEHQNWINHIINNL